MNTATWRTRQNTAGLATPSPSREATVRCSRTVSIFRSRANDRVSDPLGASRLPGVCPRSCSGTRASVSDEGTQRSRRPRVAEEVVERDRRKRDEYRPHACAPRSAISRAGGRRGWPQSPATFGPRYDSVQSFSRWTWNRDEQRAGWRRRQVRSRSYRLSPRKVFRGSTPRHEVHLLFFISNGSRAKGQSERAASRSCDRSSNRRTRDRKDRTRSRSHGERDSRLLRTTIPASWRTRGRRRERNPRCARGTSITEELPLRGYVCGIERTGTRRKSGKKKTLHQPRRYSFVAAPFAGIGPRGST